MSTRFQADIFIGLKLQVTVLGSFKSLEGYLIFLEKVCQGQNKSCLRPKPAQSEHNGHQ